MTPVAPESSPGEPNVAPSTASLGIGRDAARGAIWMTLAALAGRAVGFAQLVGLAHFLDVEAFGLLAMAGSAVALASVGLNVGLAEILIQRQRRFRLWARPALWLSLVVGAGTTLLILLAAPLAAWFYGSWRVASLVAVMALAAPLTSVAAVPTARLSAERRFRALALISTLAAVAQAAIALPLAALGAGAMSLAIANLAAVALNAALTFRLAGPIRPGPPRPRRWRHFARDAGLLVGGRAATAFCGNVDFAIVGRLAGTASLGLYSYAFNQSLQATRLLAGSAAGVLFPSLSGFESDARKYAAFARGMRLVLPLLIPFCVAQAALADPAFRLLFREAYWPAVRLFQVLSVGSFGIGAGTLCAALILSLRRNDLNLALAVASAIVYTIAAGAGFAIGRTMGVAVGMSIGAVVNLAIAHALAARAAGTSPIDAAAWYARPALLAVVSAAPAWWLVERPLADRAAIARLIAGVAIFAASYAAALPLLARPTFDEVWSRVRGRLAR